MEKKNINHLDEFQYTNTLVISSTSFMKMSDLVKVNTKISGLEKYLDGNIILDANLSCRRVVIFNLNSILT